MRLFRNCIWFMAALLVAVPVLLAFQTEQATDTSTKAEKKPKSKRKKTEQSGEAAGANATGTEASTNTGQSAAPTSETPKPRKAKSAGSAQRAMPTVSDSEIAAAKASGKVWVNTETGVYHKGGQWYGATKQGKFMTEDEAIRAGYKAAKNNK